MTTKKKLDLREAFIEIILKKDKKSNRAFLEACTTDELQRMANEDDEFPDEVNDGFNDDEDTISIPDDEM
jgi:hypothetical protein